MKGLLVLMSFEGAGRWTRFPFTFTFQLFLPLSFLCGSWEPERVFIHQGGLLCEPAHRGRKLVTPLISAAGGGSGKGMETFLHLDDASS